MTKGEMISEDVDNDSTKSESDQMEFVSATELNRKRGREDSNTNVVSSHPSKKSRFHRHTPHQINMMEALYRECHHPTDKQRKELGRDLGLEPLQVKFWFQNKRNQIKTQNDHVENIQLCAMNERLRAENMMYKDALRHVTCACCGGPVEIGDVSPEEIQLKMENSELRKEIDRVSAMAKMYTGKPLSPS